MNDAVDLEPLVIDLISRDAVRVPPYPAVAMRLQKLAGGNEFGVADLVRVAGEDQVLAATLLRAANSALYRGVEPVTTLHAAIGRIGAKEVCRIALALSVGAKVGEAGVLAPLRRKAWRQGLMSALASSRLASRRGIDPDEAFICGLLHDFGRVVAIACFEDLLATRKDARALPEAAWEVSVDRFHVDLGLVTAARWNLSDVTVAVISSHHDPSLAGKHRALVDVVVASDALVDLVEQSSVVTSKSLSALPLRSQEEIDFMLTVVPQLPAFVAGLDETAAPTGAEAAASPVQIETPQTALAGPVKRAAFPVRVLKSSGSVALQASYATVTGLGMVGELRLKENNVVRLAIEAEEPAIEAWGNVLLCLPEGGAQRIEVKFFVMDRAAQQAWDRVLAALPG